MDEIVTKLFKNTPNPDEYGPSLTITGPGGFGKTTIAIALCHHPLVTAKFTEGFIFIQLGPHPDNPSSKLSQLYHLLTGQCLKQGDVNHAEMELNLIASSLCHNILVVIDDVWHIEDAEPFLRAFRACNIVLTTRKKDVGEHLPVKKEVVVGPMKCAEAISLMIYDIIDSQLLSPEDTVLLTKIVKRLQLWPLALSLVRGQLAYNVKIFSSFSEIIKNVNTELISEGFTEFDHIDVNDHKHVLKICIGVTLKMLEEDVKSKFKRLVIWNGIGVSLHVNALHVLWNVSKVEASEIVKQLQSRGLLQFTDFKLHVYNRAQQSVEVHEVISSFLISTIQEHELNNLMLFNLYTCNHDCNIINAMTVELSKLFEESYGISDVKDQKGVDYLEYIVCETENCEMQIYLKQIMSTVTISPLVVASTLQCIKQLLTAAPTEQWLSNQKEFDELIVTCHRTAENLHELSRNLFAKVQQCITHRNYNGIATFLENYLQEFPISSVVTKALFIIQECSGFFCNSSSDTVNLIGMLQIYKPCNHDIALLFIPYFKLSIDKIGKITVALQKGSPYTDILTEVIRRCHYDIKRDDVYKRYIKKIEEILDITQMIKCKGK